MENNVFLFGPHSRIEVEVLFDGEVEVGQSLVPLIPELESFEVNHLRALVEAVVRVLII